MKSLVDRTAAGLRKAYRGPLAKFALFDDIMLVWLATNSHVESMLEWAGLTKVQLAQRERRLGEALLQLIKENDTGGLSNVVKTVKFLQENFEPYNRDLEQAVQFFLRHADQRWTWSEIQSHLREETGIWLEEKTLRRWCEEYGFPIEPDKVGRPRK